MKCSVSTLAIAAPFVVVGSALSAENVDRSWDLLSQIEIEEIITETTYEVRKVFPAALEDGVAQFDISGYLVPLTDGVEISDFILISDMGFCPFCGSPEHGTNLRVSMASPTPFQEGQRVSLRGSLEPVTDPETWQSVILTGASFM